MSRRINLEDLLLSLIGNTGSLGEVEDDEDECPYDPIYCTALDMHVHRCPKCRSTWEHPRNGGPQCKTAEDHTRAHTCPKPGCDGQAYYKQRLSTVKSITYPWKG